MDLHKPDLDEAMNSLKDEMWQDLISTLYFPNEEATEFSETN